MKEMTMEFKPVHVGPNTPYADESSEFIPPGWYVTGHDFGDDEHPAVIIKIEQAFDENSNDISEQYANRLATLLNGMHDFLRLREVETLASEVRRYWLDWPQERRAAVHDLSSHLHGAIRDLVAAAPAPEVPRG